MALRSCKHAWNTLAGICKVSNSLEDASEDSSVLAQKEVADSAQSVTTQSKPHYINQMSTISTHRGSEMRLTSAENPWKSPIQPPALHRAKVKVNSGCQSLIQSSFEKSPRMEMPQPLCQHCCCLNSVSCNSSQNSQLAVMPQFAPRLLDC